MTRHGVRVGFLYLSHYFVLGFWPLNKVLHNGELTLATTHLREQRRAPYNLWLSLWSSEFWHRVP